jgi:hypothetical protein
MSTTRKKLQGLPLSALGKGEASGGWVLDLAETPTALAAAGSSGGGAGDFIVGTEGGHVLRVSGAPPRTAWSRKLGSHAVVDLMVIGDRVAALTRNKEVFLLTLADGAGVGGFSPDGNPWLCFAPQAGKIFALDDEGKLVELAAETGAVATPSDPAIEGLLTLPPTGLIAAGGALALLHDGGHGLLVVDPRKPGPPRLRWGTRTTSRIRHVVASDGWSVVATEKGTIGLYRTPE